MFIVLHSSLKNPRVLFPHDMYGCTARSCGYPYTSSLVSGITRTPHFLVPGITRTPQKNLRLRRIIILQCQDIYAERSQSLNKFATAALIVTTVHRLKRTVCADFLFIRIVALFSSETSFADYKMVQCTGLIKKIRLRHQNPATAARVQPCL